MLYVIVADQGRARFLSVEGARNDLEGGPHLRERSELLNSEPGMTGRQRPGGKPADAANPDGHHDRHHTESERRFARRLAKEIGSLTQREKVRHLVLVAEPHLLGMLRPELAPLLPASVALKELALDLSWHSAAHIHEVLTRHGLLAAPELPRSGYAPGSSISGKT